MKIMIDAGHGFETAGKRTVDEKMREYEFNRVVANAVRLELQQYESVAVYFSHSDQKDIPLQERTDEANSLNVDLFVSIHANAYGNGRDWNSVQGIETFVYLTNPTEAKKLATQVQAQLVKMTGRTDRGVKTANLHVLRETKMTAILCECGFMTNKEEAAMLMTEEYRFKCAQSIVKGIVNCYKLKKKTQQALYHVQVGAFSKKASAETLIAKLKMQGFDAYLKVE
ncbi:N-acetylmuramoyl-L-alanine amidase [Metabacillus herbersteinensis]|uniref:N-acetylmuramoyl-L-alanine amidase n=1 Tax=Metabacillus herbersteinensis TaxID=283816 RepID=A0ABV6GI01_9BACI